MGMCGRFRENILDDALRESSGSLVLFLYDFNTHPRFDVRHEDSVHEYRPSLCLRSVTARYEREFKKLYALITVRPEVYPPSAAPASQRLVKGDQGVAE
jgi:hypothetical protein